MGRQISLRSGLIAIALAVLLTQGLTILYLDGVIFPNSGIKNTPSDASYVIKSDGSLVSALRPDGSVQFQAADAYTVIQSAINATQVAMGGKVFITIGTYRLTHTILVYKYITIEGESMEGVTFVQNHNGDMFDLTKRPRDSQLIGFVQLKDLTIMGLKRSYANGYGINNPVFSDSTFDHVFIDNMPSDAIRLGSVAHNRIEDCWLESNGGYGVSFVNGTSASWVTNTMIYNNTLDGVYVQNAHSPNFNHFEGNWIEYNWRDGMNLLTSNDASITGNIFYNNGRGVSNTYAHLYLDSSIHSTATGNIFDGNANLKYVIMIASTGSLTFNGNSVVGAGMTGTLFVGGTLTSPSSLVVKDNAGLNPIGLISNPFQNAYGRIGLGGNSASLVASEDYNVLGVDLIVQSAGGVGVNITVTDGAGHIVFTNQSLLTSFYLPDGWNINWGSFSVSPTVTVFGN